MSSHPSSMHGYHSAQAEAHIKDIWNPDNFHPDSKFWHGKATAAMQNLADELGTETYREWAELTWPGATIDDKTWRDIHTQTTAAFSLFWKGERDVVKLAEAAKNAG